MMLFTSRKMNFFFFFFLNGEKDEQSEQSKLRTMMTS